jgi:hypothetical protein
MKKARASGKRGRQPHAKPRKLSPLPTDASHSSSNQCSSSVPAVYVGQRNATQLMPLASSGLQSSATGSLIEVKAGSACGWYVGGGEGEGGRGVAHKSKLRHSHLTLPGY